jgi:hypothetical protein
MAFTDPFIGDSFKHLAVIQIQLYPNFGEIKLVKKKKWVGSEKLFV